jgi:hypothetical protein
VSDKSLNNPVTNLEKGDNKMAEERASAVGEYIRGHKVVKPGQVEPFLTRGKVRHGYLHGAPLRIYAKPSLGKDITRTSRVLRKSAFVLLVNDKLAAMKPAKACKGKSFYDGSFQKCLREQMLGKMAVKLATAV